MTAAQLVSRGSTPDRGTLHVSRVRKFCKLTFVYNVRVLVSVCVYVFCTLFKRNVLHRNGTLTKQDLKLALYTLKCA